MSKLEQDNLSEPVGRFARRDYTAFRAGQPVGQALESLRRGTIAEKIVYFYVVDAHAKLVGVVPTRRLLMSQPDVLLDDIMVRNVISIPETMSVLEACEFFVMHRLLAFPVVDAEGRLKGVVDVSLFTDEMFGVSEKMSAEDVFQIIGVHIARGHRGSPWAGFTNRFPWLMCNITGGLICALIAGRYESFLNMQIVLALFIPVVLNLAEGVSMQSMTMTLQGFHGGSSTRRIDPRSLLRSLGRELPTAVILGLASGAVVGGVAWLWKRHALVALAIGGSIWLSMITSCLLGILLPTLVRLLRGDPKIAAGPVVLATADVATLLFYFHVAMTLLR